MAVISTGLTMNERIKELLIKAIREVGAADDARRKYRKNFEGDV